MPDAILKTDEPKIEAISDKVFRVTTSVSQDISMDSLNLKIGMIERQIELLQNKKDELLALKASIEAIK